MIDRILSRIDYTVKKIKANTKRKKKSRVITWAIAGTGNMAKTFARALMLEPDATVYAVSSRSESKANRFAKEFGAVAYSDYEKMLLDEDIDVVYIAVPHKYHYTYIKQALLASKNVICEKPITSTTAELCELIGIAKDKGVLLMEGMWSACLPINNKAKVWIDSGAIGKITRLNIDLSKKEVEDINKAVFNKEEGGGVLFDYGIYTIAFAVMYLGDELFIKNVKRENRDSGIDKSWEIVLSNGEADAHITISSDNEGSREAKIIGELGEVCFSRQFNRTNHVLLYENEKLRDEYKTKYISQGFEYEIREVHRLIESGETESGIVSHKASMCAIKLCEELLGRE